MGYKRPWRCTYVGDCREPGRWEVFAAYDHNPADVHPTVSRYPAPLHAACDAHLPMVLDRDGDAPFSTLQYVVRRSTRGEPDDR